MTLALLLSLFAAPAAADPLAEAFQAARAAAPKPPVCAHPLTSARSGNGQEHVVWSGVCESDPSPSFAKAMEEQFAVYGATPPAGYRQWVYETRISNRGSMTVELAVPEPDFARSPFAESAGGFAIRIPPGKTLVVIYATIVKPKVLLAPVHFGSVDAAGRFRLEGGGASTFYVPDGWATTFVTLKSAVVDAPKAP